MVKALNGNEVEGEALKGFGGLGWCVNDCKKS